MSLGSSLNETPVVCPHCWHEFYSDQAVFISRHPDLFGDPVLGEMENRRFAPHEVQMGRGSEAYDPKGWKMTERGCPRCHLQIPPSVLRQKPFFLSIVGAPRSGKTYFLTSMVHCLRKELATKFALSLHDSDSHEVRAFLEYEKKLFGAADPNQPTFLQKTQEQGNLYNTVRLDGVDVQLPKPFIFSFQPTTVNPFAAKIKAKTQRNLVMYDNAGESFDLLKEKAGHIRVTQHLAACDAVLFNFDLLQVHDARIRLVAYSRDPQVTRLATSYRQETILQEVIHRIRRHRGLAPDEIIRPLLVVCVQKYDVWKELLPHKEYRDANGTRRKLIDHSSVEFFEKEGVAGLDVEEINRISLFVRALINDLCPEFVATAESNFGVVRYFPVSALGTSPELEEPEGDVALNTNMLKVRPINMSPFRVTHPLLWLLHRWGLIRRTTYRVNRADKYPHATVTPLADSRLRVMAPRGASIFTVDEEYMESMVLDPVTGEEMWIPRVHWPPPVASPPRSEQKPKAQAPDKLKLKIEKPNSPPRRGWFKK